MPGDVTTLPVAPENDKAKLRSHITELTAQMMLALRDPNAIPALKDVRDTLGSLIDVYRLLHGTGDLDAPPGEALSGYREKFNGSGNQGRSRNRA